MEKSLVFVISRFHPYKGGAEQNCLQMALAATNAGYQVTVLTTNIGPTSQRLPGAEIYQGIKIVRHHAWNKQFSLGFHPGLLISLLRIKADIVHYENGPGMFWQELCLLVKRLISWRTNFIATPHGRFISTPRTHSGLKRLVALAAKRIFGWYFKILWPRLFKTVIAVNSHQQTWLRLEYGFKPEQIVLVPNGIPSSVVIMPGQKQLDEPQVVITSLGRLAKYKGHHRVIAAFARAYPNIKSCQPKLVIMGQNEAGFLETLNSQIDKLGMQEYINIVLAPDETTKWDWLKKSQIHILASDWEATGISLLEAMATGNAIMTSNTNEAASDLITPGQSGYIFELENIDQLTDYITQLCQNAELRKAMIFTNLARVSKLTWEQITPKYLEILRK